MYKVVIPSAGLGSRVALYSKHMNKALISIGTKPVIARIIEKFPEDVELVIPVGYLGEQIKDVVRMLFPSRKIIFVDIDVYQGEGSGLGYTLLKCRDHLQCPFIFLCQ